MGFLQALDSYFRCFRKIKGRTTLKKAVAVITLIAFMIANFNAVYIPRAFAEVSPAVGGNFLIVEDLQLWGTDANQSALESLGIPFQTIESSELASFDFKSNKIKVILIASSQYRDTYKNLFNIRSKLDDFVKNGGVLIVTGDHSGQDGDWSDLPFVPGGLSHHDGLRRLVWIADRNSPIVQNVDNPIVQNKDDGIFYEYTGVGEFTNLPPGTKIILVNGEGTPAYVEYRYGKGTVLGTMIVLEAYYSSGYQSVVNLMLNQFAYAYSLTDTSPQVTITEPQDISWVNGQVPITVQGANTNSLAISITDSTTGAVVFQETVQKAQNTWLWDSTSVANGSYLITVQGKNSNGEIDEDQILIGVYNAPEVKITAPQDLAPVNGNVPINVQGTNIKSLALTITDWNTGAVVFQETVEKTQNNWL